MTQESDGIVAAIKGMSDAFIGRINKTDSDFVEHARRVESQMEQLVDLTKHMAVMNEKSDSLRGDIAEIKTLQRSNQEKTDTSIGRLHHRIDEINNHARTHADLIKENLEAQLGAIKDKHSKLDEEYKGFVNRIDGAKKLATGLWILFTFIVATFGFLGKSWIESLEREKHDQAVSIKRLELQVREATDLVERKLK